MLTNKPSRGFRAEEDEQGDNTRADHLEPQRQSPSQVSRQISRCTIHCKSCQYAPNVIKSVVETSNCPA